MYNYSENFELNGCISRGACSVSPNISAMKEYLLYILSQIAFYLEYISNFEDKYFNFLIKIISNIDIRNEYSDEQMLKIFKMANLYLNKVKELYLNIFEKNNNINKKIFKFDESTSMTQLIRYGELILRSKQKCEKPEQKYLKDILFLVIKAICCNYLVLNDYGDRFQEAEHSILNSLVLYGDKRANCSSLKAEISVLAQYNIAVQLRVYEKVEAVFGKPEKVLVNSSTRKNKAILVSGSSLIELKNILDATQNTDIDVYTNGNLLISHAFPKFKEYKNLQGQFGNSIENTVLDFATFPGSILLTKREYQNTEYLYQGKFFGTSDFLPKGISHTDNDYKNLLDYTLNARGFVKASIREQIVTGIDYKELDAKLSELLQKIKSGKIKKVILIGMGTQLAEQYEYFKKFSTLIDKDDFIITFSHNSDINNSLYINVSNNYQILVYVLSKIFDKIDISNENIYFFILRCDPNSMTTIIYLKSMGAKNIYFANCPSTMINPTVLKIFKQTYNLLDMTLPESDLKNINKKTIQ
ncbi:MAG: hypothetical protein LKG27_04865 [Clostridiaceae bacterium]|nr:hypothetical protein [Clostridiaceae bacterium]